MASDEREVMIVGYAMPQGADSYKGPSIPGWKAVSAQRMAFGISIIYEKVKGDQDGDEGETGKQD